MILFTEWVKKKKLKLVWDLKKCEYTKQSWGKLLELLQHNDFKLCYRALIIKQYDTEQIDVRLIESEDPRNNPAQQQSCDLNYYLNLKHWIKDNLFD